MATTLIPPPETRYSHRPATIIKHCSSVHSPQSTTYPKPPHNFPPARGPASPRPLPNRNLQFPQALLQRPAPRDLTLRPPQLLLARPDGSFPFAVPSPRLQTEPFAASLVNIVDFRLSYAHRQHRVPGWPQRLGPWGEGEGEGGLTANVIRLLDQRLLRNFRGKHPRGMHNRICLLLLGREELEALEGRAGPVRGVPVCDSGSGYLHRVGDVPDWEGGRGVSRWWRHGWCGGRCGGCRRRCCGGGVQGMGESRSGAE